jgi:hypothetical protein
LTVTSALLIPATMLVIAAVVLLLLMTPLWTHFAMDASGATLFFATPEMAHSSSDRTVAELFVGPGAFALFEPDEAAHLRDVRVILFAFLGLAVLSATFIGWALARRGGDPRTWRAIARGGAGFAVLLVALGVIAAVAFGAAFELFHRLLFPGGNWSFPATSWLIKTYPYGFWQLSAAAFGILGIGGGAVVWALARRRARSLQVRAAGTQS